MYAEIVDFANGNNTDTKSVAMIVGYGRENRYFWRTRSIMGTPEMKAMSLLFEVIRTPMCHSLW